MNRVFGAKQRNFSFLRKFGRNRNNFSGDILRREKFKYQMKFFFWGIFSVKIEVDQIEIIPSVIFLLFLG